jgi:hypothetical protein
MQIKGNISVAQSLQASSYLQDTGAANAYVVTPDPAMTSYTDGLLLSFKAANTNTGASTINVNGLGVKNIRKNVVDALEAGDITSGQVVDLVYDGTNFQLKTVASSGSGSLPVFKQINFRVGYTDSPVADTDTSFNLQDCTPTTLTGKSVKFFRDRDKQFLGVDYTYDTGTGQIDVTVPFAQGELVTLLVFDSSLWENCDIGDFF